MSRYIDADRLNDEYNEHIGAMVKRSEYRHAVIMTDAQEMLQKSPAADVIPLDRIKEAREEMYEASRADADGWNTVIDLEDAFEILDKLIAEVEGTNEAN